ncbi:unnamed protein product [Mycena citricolor]|uniref:mitogen-activated protein kinase kinase n=1 Tax=Mycena citricolor TaxID=2018698 RepID=A0AAD2K6R9_9AGAR|nr:unnamed protein product [Mycena citricolor]
MGPRAISSPSPQIASTAPLNIRKPQRPSLALPTPPSARTPTPNLSLSIPHVASRPTTPKLGLNIPPRINTQSRHGDGDDSPQSMYYGGPPLSLPAMQSPHADLTIRPDSGATAIPPVTKHEPLDSLKSILDSLPQQGTQSHPPSDSEENIPALPSAANLPWTDGVLEELSRLGEGAGGAVHKVKDKRTGRLMARKTITTREAPMKQLLRELSIISSTEHINIIRFHGAYMSPSSSEVKILMDFCEGGSLEAVGRQIKERNGIVGEKIAGRLAEGILQGLAYLHSKKTIHRDIKPSNILLSRQGIVKLCDFGVSGELIESMAGTFTGTSFYMAPERISGQEYGIRSDVWSTGISLLELAQNRFPFPPDLPPIELMMYITAGEPPRLEDEPGLEWSDEMKDFIKQTQVVDSRFARPSNAEGSAFSSMDCFRDETGD